MRFWVGRSEKKKKINKIGKTSLKMGGTVPQHNISMDPLKQSGKNRRRCQIKREQGNKDEPPKLHTNLPASMTFQQLLERIVSIFRISRLYAE